MSIYVISMKWCCSLGRAALAASPREAPFALRLHLFDPIPFFQILGQRPVRALDDLVAFLQTLHNLHLGVRGDPRPHAPRSRLAFPVHHEDDLGEGLGAFLRGEASRRTLDWGRNVAQILVRAN